MTPNVTYLYCLPNLHRKHSGDAEPRNKSNCIDRTISLTMLMFCRLLWQEWLGGWAGAVCELRKAVLGVALVRQMVDHVSRLHTAYLKTVNTIEGCGAKADAQNHIFCTFDKFIPSASYLSTR